MDVVCVLFTISRFLMFKLATDPISIENSLSAEIGQVTNFRGLKSDWWLISVMEIGSLNQPIHEQWRFRLSHIRPGMVQIEKSIQKTDKIRFDFDSIQ